MDLVGDLSPFGGCDPLEFWIRQVFGVQRIKIGQCADFGFRQEFANGLGILVVDQEPNGRAGREVDVEDSRAFEPELAEALADL